MLTDHGESGLGGPGVFGGDAIDQLVAFYRQHGFAVLAGAISEGDLCDLERECVDAQEALVAGRLDGRYGTLELIEADAGPKAQEFANYVLEITELSPT